MHEGLRREVRTCASHCEDSLHSLSIYMLNRHLHIILKVKNTKYIRWTGPQPVKPFIFVTWPTVARPQTERIPYTKQSRASWEHWLGRIPTLVACKFPGLNSFGARRRAASAWLAEETRFPETIPPVTVLKAVGFIIQFQKKDNIYRKRTSI